MKKEIILIRIIICLSFLVHLVPQNLKAQDSNSTIKKTDIEQFVNRASDLIIERYVFEQIGEDISLYIKDQLANGKYDDYTDAEAFALKLTKEIQSISHDKHMRVRFRRPAPGRMTDATADLILDNYLRRLKQEEENYGFKKVSILENNIGYVDFHYFADPEEAADRVAPTMSFLKYSDAIIFDMRYNTGGSPRLIQLVCSYLFDEKVHLNSLYWRAGNRTEEFWTLDEIEGVRMPDVPVYVLTSKKTFSGAEEFTYNLKTRKRATIIGETTGGGANPGGFYPVTEKFGMFIPTGRAINPVTGTNWEGVGVEPDIKVAADSALTLAIKKASEAVENHNQLKINTAKLVISEINGSMMQGENLLDKEQTKEATDKIYQALDLGRKHILLDESSINMMGYDYLGKQKYQCAIVVFAYNVRVYPDASNTYDSLGEAYMNAGKTELAVSNYKKSLELNPNNTNAIEMLEKMKQK